MNKHLFDSSILEAGLTMNRAPDARMQGVVRINAQHDSDEAEVFIYGDIGGFYEDSVNALEFSTEVADLEVKTILVRMNSGGGGVFDGIAIYNALARHSAKIIVEIDGIAASIASVIAMAGDEIRISEGASMMVHKPWSIAVGDADDFRETAEVLDKLQDGIVNIYTARTGKTRAQVEKLVNAETWFLGKEAVEAGFADGVRPAKNKSKKAAASSMLAMFNNTPDGLLSKVQDSIVARDLEKLLRDGEGFSNAQAKRTVAYAARAFSQANKPVEPTPTLRDEGDEAAVMELKRLTAHIRSKLKK